MLLIVDSSALLSPKVIRWAAEPAFRNIRDITGIIDVTKSGMWNPVIDIVAPGGKPARKLFEDEGIGSFRPMRPPAGPVFSLMNVFHTASNGSFPLRFSFEVHGWSCEKSDSTSRQNRGELDVALGAETDGTSCHPLAKADEETTGDRRLSGAGCRAGRCGEGVLIAMARGSGQAMKND
jgi:hypothetical protein